MPLINGFTVFGLLFLLMNIWRGTELKKREAKHYDWPDEEKNMKENWMWYKILLAVDAAIIATGVIWWLATGGPIV